MTPDLYQRVALRRDLEEHQLKAGDVAVLIDHVPHPSGGEGGVVLEVFNALGASIAVVTAPESAIEPLREDEVLAVRPRQGELKGAGPVIEPPHLRGDHPSAGRGVIRLAGWRKDGFRDFPLLTDYDTPSNTPEGSCGKNEITTGNG